MREVQIDSLDTCLVFVVEVKQANVELSKLLVFCGAVEDSAYYCHLLFFRLLEPKAIEFLNSEFSTQSLLDL